MWCEDCYGKLDKLIGTHWIDLKKAKLSSLGFVPVYFERKSDHTFSLWTYYDYKGIAAPSPEIVFEAQPDKRLVNVLSKEDYFSHGESTPQREYLEVSAESNNNDTKKLQRELNNYLSEWLQILIEENFELVEEKNERNTRNCV